jgi:integrase
MREAIPCAFVDNSPRFILPEIETWLKLAMEQSREEFLKEIAERWENLYPDSLRMLREFDSHMSPPREPKGFSLEKIPNKRHGFLYYVRYLVNGKLITSRWNTHTNDKAQAEQYAKENRERILAGYHAKKAERRDPYTILEAYYHPDSPYLKIDRGRGRTLSEHRRRQAYNFITKRFIPFLKKEKVRGFDDITPPVLVRFQNSLLEDGCRADTVNAYLSYIRPLYEHLVITGVVKDNVFDKTRALKIADGVIKPRGCYEITQVSGVFNDESKWNDRLSYLLCLLIYATGMRNNEIETMRVQDIIKMGDVNFIDIKKSKSRAGVRLVPLHPFVHKKLMAYINDKGLSSEDRLVSNHGRAIDSGHYTKAYIDMGAVIGVVDNEPNDTLENRLRERLDEMSISFYSGRHYWKTLMSSENLGEVDEIFMGHKVSSDVAKRYNHRDKQGQEKLLGKAREVFAILDRTLFTYSLPTPAPPLSPLSR